MMDKKSSVRFYGVLGFPARHSLSPVMHNAAFKNLKMNAEYKIFEKRPEELKAFLSTLGSGNIYGLNVTVPYKEKVIPFLSKISEGAGLIAAVNTIKAADNRLEGFNTDGEGFLRHLTEDLKFDPKGKIISLLGAGGAAKAVSVYLAKMEPRSVSIYDIDKVRTGALVNRLKESFDNTDFKIADSIEKLKIEECDLLVNATPVGMKETDPCLVDERLIRENLLVYDLIYNPKETKLLRMAKQNGAIVSNGLGMLLYQGVLSFEVWTQEPAPLEVMRQALNKAVNKL